MWQSRRMIQCTFPLSRNMFGSGCAQLLVPAWTDGIWYGKQWGLWEWCSRASTLGVRFEGHLSRVPTTSIACIGSFETMPVRRKRISNAGPQPFPEKTTKKIIIMSISYIGVTPEGKKNQTQIRTLNDCNPILNLLSNLSTSFDFPVPCSWLYV